MCHTPVGRQPSQMALGLNPQAPNFEENVMTVAQLFWVTKNGIRFIRGAAHRHLQHTAVIVQECRTWLQPHSTTENYHANRNNECDRNDLRRLRQQSD